MSKGRASVKEDEFNKVELAAVHKARTSRSLSQWRRHRLIKDAYETGCFDSKDYAGQMMDLWQAYDHDMDLNLTLNEIKDMMRYGFPEQADDLSASLSAQDVNTGADGKITAEEFFSFMTDNYDNLTFPPPGRLKPSCRNHHWGLLSACKPTFVSATYQIQNFKATSVRRIPGPYITVEISFEALGSKQRAGWYKSRLSIYSERSYDEERGISYFLCMNLQLLLVFLLLGIELLCTYLMLPSNLHALSSLQFDEGTPYEDVKPIIKRRLLALFDGRGRRSEFMGLGAIFFEQLLMWCILFNWFEAIREAFEPAPMPLGYRSPECKKAIFNRRASQAAEYLSGTASHRIMGLSEYEKLQMCYNFSSTVAYAAAMEEELFFQSSIGVSKLVMLLLMLRLMEVLDFSRFFRWLPDTMRMAFWKLFNFLLIYFLVVLGLAVIFTAKFGSMYPQFRSVGQSGLALLLFSFGDTDRATEGMQPFIEDSGTLGAMWLLLFTICITTIGLGFFTTIVLDAYTLVNDPENKVGENGMLDDLAAIIAPYYGCDMEKLDAGAKTDEDKAAEEKSRISVGSSF